MSLPSRQSPPPPPPLTSSGSLPFGGGAEETSSTWYCEWYNGLCIWRRYCLGWGEVIQWHFNRESTFFAAVALVLICGIKNSQTPDILSCCWEEQFVSENIVHPCLHAGNKPWFPVWQKRKVLRSDEIMVSTTFKILERTQRFLFCFVCLFVSF